MVRGPPGYVFVLLVVLFTGQGGPAGGVAPLVYGSLCELSACHCDRANANIACRCSPKIQEIVLQATGYDFLPNTVGSIEIDGCETVTVVKRSIRHINPLRKVSLKNIVHLQLDEEALSWDTVQNIDMISYPGIDIVIANSSIPDLPSDVFKGRINSVSLKNVNITLIKALAFANIAMMDKIEFFHSNIEKIAPQAFKKLIVNTMTIEGGRIGLLPSYSMNSLEIIHGLNIENVKIDSIQSSALKGIECKVFRLQSCTILQLEGEAFLITTKGPIFIDDNVIQYTARGAFVGIHLDPRSKHFSGTQELVFENNTLTKFEEQALLLNTSGMKPRIDRIVINKPCTCTDIKSWSAKLVKYIPHGSPDNIAQIMWCHKGKIDEVFSDYELRNCVSHVSRVYFIVTILIIILLTLICLLSVGFWIFRKHAKRYMNVPTNEGNNRLSVLSTTSNRIIVIPESKIYRETELNIMTEYVEPIKEYVPPHEVTAPNQGEQ